MELPIAKRVYSPPFSSTETTLLVEILKTHRKVLEGKETDANSVAEKNRAWEEVTNEFNAQGVHTFRNSLTLRNRWRLLKKDARKQFAESKKYASGTGGGPAGKEPSELYNSIISIAGDLTIEGGKNSPDCDSALVNGVFEVPTINGSKSKEPVVGASTSENFYTSEQEFLIEELTEEEHGLSQSEEIWNGSGYTPRMLKTTPSKPLTSKTPVTAGSKNRTYDVYKTNCEKKKEVLVLQEEHFQAARVTQNIEAEGIKKKIKNDEELHELRKGNEVQQHVLFTEEFKTRQTRETALYEAEVQRRFVEKRRTEELFNLEKERLKLEILIMKKKLGQDNNNDSD